MAIPHREFNIREARDFLQAEDITAFHDEMAGKQAPFVLPDSFAKDGMLAGVFMVQRILPYPIVFHS